MTTLRLVVAGCTGRTGRAVVEWAAKDPEIDIVGGLTAAGDPALGRDLGPLIGLDPLGIPITESCDADCDVMIEFTLPAGCRALANWCGENGVALVSGTTGLDEHDRAALSEAAERVPVLWAPNMSIGINLMLMLVEQAARTLGPDWDIEICETHHRHKLDAPSGTARALYETACTARNYDALESATYGRYGQCGPRNGDEIGLHAIRLGGSIGEHTVHFGAESEMLTLSHRAQGREIFATGALRAAKWLKNRPAGRYYMRDVLSEIVNSNDPQDSLLP